MATCYESYLAALANLSSLEEMIAGDDRDLAAMASEEIDTAKTEITHLDEQLQWHLIPKDPDDERNIYLEVRAGTGGDEAAIFAGDLYVCTAATRKIRLAIRINQCKPWGTRWL